MAAPTHMPRGAPTHRGSLVAAIAAILVFLAIAGSLHAQQPDATTDQQTPPATTLEIDFDDLGLLSSGGELIVDYEVAADDWDELRGADIDLWVQIRVPTGLTYPDSTNSYTLPIESRSGRITYPRWLTGSTTDEAGLCLLGTGPGDNLVWGRGYRCADVTTLAVEHQRPDDASHPVTFELQYLTGPPYVPYAPWVEPRVPNFQGPFDQLPAP